jgi:DNA repair exonuclease SbcCD ATPase subunit
VITWIQNNQWLINFLVAVGITTLANILWGKIFNRRENNANLSKTEQEVKKIALERYIVEANINDLVKREAKILDDNYKDLILKITREHFEVKDELQKRWEKEMKRRLEVEQDNEILRNELDTFRSKIDELTQKVKELEKHNS